MMGNKAKVFVPLLLFNMVLEVVTSIKVKKKKKKESNSKTYRFTRKS